MGRHVGAAVELGGEPGRVGQRPEAAVEDDVALVGDEGLAARRPCGG